MKSTRILLSDHHPSVRRGWRIILEAAKHYDVCGEAADGKEALELALDLAPDILVTAISMPRPNGLQVAVKLREADSEIKILVMTMHDSEEMLHAAAAAGVNGYLLKSEAEELLVPALQSLEEGNCFVSPTFNSDLVRQLYR